MHEFRYYQLRERRVSTDIALLFPEWQGARECVMVLSPHDDDALLGAGYAMLAAAQEGAAVHVCIYCDGSAGYSDPTQREHIVEIRRQEAALAYADLGLGPEHMHRLELPDFGARAYLGRRLPGGGEGTLERVVALLRSTGTTRLLIPNGYREHSDHEATYDSGRYDGVQAGDPILADLGRPSAVRSTLIYPVWGDLSPEDALQSGDDLGIRANCAIVADYAAEERVSRALRRWESQSRIIDGLLKARRDRDCGRGMLEVYLDIDPRPRLSYGPYIALVNRLDDQA